MIHKRSIDHISQPVSPNPLRSSPFRSARTTRTRRLFADQSDVDRSGALDRQSAALTEADEAGWMQFDQTLLTPLPKKMRHLQSAPIDSSMTPPPALPNAAPLSRTPTRPIDNDAALRFFAAAADWANCNGASIWLA